MAHKSEHPITKTSYADRASAATHPLTSYLLRLMTLKQSNLCLSADVSTANQLLQLASTCGPSIVVLKTHYDIISNWDYHPQTGTGAKLQKLARKYGFLVFEDRKFGDIGSTVQKQYTEGTARIVEWANVVNVNMVPGKASVESLRESAMRWRERRRFEVRTEIGVGTPRAESVDGEDGEGDVGTPRPSANNASENGNVGENGEGGGLVARDAEREREGRKASIVSITTVSQHFEPVNSPRGASVVDGEGEEEVLEGIEEAPVERGLLILAQMSSEGNFMTGGYTDACVEAARESEDFVMGFIAQESLNTQGADQFITMTPGCQLPPESEDEDAEVKGDGMGQQYNTPQKIIGAMGNDIVIVGRGIIKAADPVREAERYRKKAWEAYEERIAA